MLCSWDRELEHVSREHNHVQQQLDTNYISVSPVSLSFSLSVSLCLSVFLSPCLSVSLSVFPSLSLSLCFSLDPSVYLCLSLCLSVSPSLSFRLSLSLSLRISLSLSVCLSLSAWVPPPPELPLSGIWSACNFEFELHNLTLICIVILVWISLATYKILLGPRGWMYKKASHLKFIQSFVPFFSFYLSAV